MTFKHRLMIKHMYTLSMVVIMIITMLVTQDFTFRIYGYLSLSIVTILVINIHRKTEKKQVYINYLLSMLVNMGLVLTFINIDIFSRSLLIYSQLMIVLLYPLKEDKIKLVFIPHIILMIVMSLFTKMYGLLLEFALLYTIIFLYHQLVSKFIKQLKSELKGQQRTINQFAYKDSLSGLYSNTYIFDYLQRRIEHINKSDLAVLMLDIDNFKRINDTYGHLFGDRIIQDISRILEASTTNDDVLGRYGGEEFIVILNNADFERSLEVAEDIRSKIEKLEIKSDTMVTISIGIAFYNNDTADALIKRADDQLYHAKKLGKNRVEGKKEEL